MTISVHAQLILAKSYFDLKDFNRVVHCLKNMDATSADALFLSLYAQYMRGEKEKNEAAAQTSNPLDKAQVMNTDLSALKKTLQEKHEKRELDGFGYFLYGVILRDLCDSTGAIDALIESVNRFPCNWSAWKTLSELVRDKNTLTTAMNRTPDHWMRKFFMAEVVIETTEFYPVDDVVDYMQKLVKRFAESSYVLAQLALVLYNVRKFDDAQTIFEDLLTLDPHRLELVDIYSNILYVKEQRGKLSHIAHRAMKTDKYRPESCCVVGNYYSMCGMHEKAVLYFQRALALNPHFLSAWTLMGHEYIEMRNTPAAIQAYRKAIDGNPRDYRAWYGIGQTYELLEMFSYAIYYFRRVVQMRPFDSRMWCALASSYEGLGRIEDAIMMYKRAQLNHDEEGIALYKLAKLYEKLNDEDAACECFRQLVERYDNGMSQGHDHVEGLLYVAEYSERHGDLETACGHANRILESGVDGVSLRKAKEILQRVKPRMKH